MVMEINVREAFAGIPPIFVVGLVGVAVYLIVFLFFYATPVRSFLYLEFLFLPSMLVILGFVSKYDKGIFRKAALYFMIGLFWELLTESNWAYADKLVPMIYFYKDIPLAMLFYWVSTFSLGFLSYSRITRKFRINMLASQIITIFTVFLVAESIGFNVLRIWAYNLDYTFLIPPFFLPPQIYVGYLIFGNLFLIFMHKTQKPCSN